MFQRKYLLFIATLVAGALLWTAGWFWFADKLRADITAFAQQQRAEGVLLDWSDLSVTGFPVRFDTTFRSPVARTATRERSISWAGADTSIRPFVEGPGVVSFRAPGRHRVDIAEDGKQMSLAADTRDLKGRLSFTHSGQVSGLRGRAEPLNLLINEAVPLKLSNAAFDWERRNGADAPEGIHPEGVGESLSLVLEQIDLTHVPLDPGVARMLGRTVERLAGQIDLRGPLQPESVSAKSLARWREAGGTLEVESLTLNWGPLRIAGNGTLTVDQALQPVGAFAARISGLDTVLDLLEQRGEVRPQQAALARIALAVLTHAPENGGPPEARVPVSIQNRMLSIGPVPLIQLPAVTWN
jgi:hypothetical protein